MSSSEVLCVACVVFSLSLNLVRDTSALTEDGSRSLTPVQRLALEYELRQLLELPDLPTNNGSVGSMTDHDSAGMRFLKELYEKRKSHDHRGSADIGLSEEDLRNSQLSDVIETYSATIADFPGLRFNEGKMLSFNIPSEGSLITAKLNIAINKNWTKQHDNNSYTVIADSISYDKNGSVIYRYIDSVQIRSEDKWISLNVTQLLNYWIQNPKMKELLYISVNSINNVQDLKIEDIILITQNDHNNRPFIAGFFSDIEHKKVQQQNRIERIKRSIMTKEFVKRSVPRRARMSACARNDFYVDFTELQWNSWIRVPRGYYMSYCQGRCVFPLSDHMNATNHAILQTIVHSTLSDAVPEPCCVPSKLSTMSVVIYVDEGRYRIRHLQDMIVNSCGCR